jgi:DNA-binding SARP family transcriptional activator
VEFGVLGIFEARRDGTLVSVGRRAERCLLGLLLLESGREVGFDRMADLLWADTPPRDPRSALHTYVSRLRAALGHSRERIQPIALVCSGSGYRAEFDADTVDALRFRALVAQARGVEDPAGRARLLRSALKLRRGPLLADVATEAIRQRLGTMWDESWMTSREDAVAAELACGMHRELVAELTGLSAEYPFRERITALLMRALYRCGRAADALSAYARVERLMLAEFAITPGVELQDLRTRILRAELD